MTNREVQAAAEALKADLKTEIAALKAQTKSLEHEAVQLRQENYECRRMREELGSSVRDLTLLMSGGSDPSKGLIVQVDRLIQTANASKQRSWMALGAALSAMVGMIVRHFAP